jgi:hypothetical protein
MKFFPNPFETNTTSGIFLFGIAIGMIVVIIAKNYDIKNNYIKKPVQ